MIINKNSYFIRLLTTGVLAAVAALGAAFVAGILITPEKLQSKIDSTPAIIQLRDKVDSLERSLTTDRAEAATSRNSIDERLFTMNGQLSAVARTVGAEVTVPNQKPPHHRSGKHFSDSALLRKSSQLTIRWSF